ncbi:hypothetical protein MY1884_006805 [Beauveria asiatica]
MLTREFTLGFKAVEQGEALTNILDTAILEMTPTVLDTGTAFAVLYAKFNAAVAVTAAVVFLTVEIVTSSWNIDNRRRVTKAAKADSQGKKLNIAVRFVGDGSIEIIVNHGFRVDYVIGHFMMVNRNPRMSLAHKIFAQCLIACGCVLLVPAEIPLRPAAEGLFAFDVPVELALHRQHIAVRLVELLAQVRGETGGGGGCVRQPHEDPVAAEAVLGVVLRPGQLERCRPVGLGRRVQVIVSLLISIVLAQKFPPSVAIVYLHMFDAHSEESPESLDSN